MTRNYDVMVAGHLCLDIIPRFFESGITDLGRLLRPGKLVNVGEVKLSTGGPVSNTGINMKTLGNRVCFCARVGDDELGRLTIEMLGRSGHANGIRVAEGMSSSYTIVVAPPGIDRIFLHNPATNDTFGPEDLDPELIAQCRHFHFGYPPLMARMHERGGVELREIFRLAKQAGATTSCDMTLPDPQAPSGRVDWLAILEDILPYVDLFLPSIEETFFMYEREAFLAMKEAHQQAELIDFLTPADYSRLADKALAMGARLVSLKSGHRGFYVKTAGREAIAELAGSAPLDIENWSDRELWAPAFTVDRFGSATGSGDSSIAGLLSGYLRGLTLEASLKCAICCGLQNVRELDAVSGIRPWDETQAMLARNLPLIDARIDAADWHYEVASQLWHGPADRLHPAGVSR